jgi:hypothetical protein
MEKLVTTSEDTFTDEDFRIEGARKAVLRVLEARRLTIPGSARELISGSTDLNQLDLWTSRALIMPTVEEVFK